MELLEDESADEDVSTSAAHDAGCAHELNWKPSEITKALNEYDETNGASAISPNNAKAGHWIRHWSLVCGMM